MSPKLNVIEFFDFHSISLGGHTKQGPKCLQNPQFTTLWFAKTDLKKVTVENEILKLTRQKKRSR